jgi:hypothetical protein
MNKGTVLFRKERFPSHKLVVFSCSQNEGLDELPAERN